MENKDIAFTLEYHQSCLKNSCRISGNRAQAFAEIDEGKKSTFVISIKIKYIYFYGIDVTYDSDLHPKVMFSSCMNRAKNAKVLSVDNKTDEEYYLGEKEQIQIISELWKSHSRINSKLCMKMTENMKVEDPKEQVKDVED